VQYEGTKQGKNACFLKILVKSLNYGGSAARVRSGGFIGIRNSCGDSVKDLRWLNGGAEGDRTPDLCNAIAALSQLSYGPEPFSPPLGGRVAAPDLGKAGPRRKAVDTVLSRGPSIRRFDKLTGYSG
jgi:hypothetical protein